MRDVWHVRACAGVGVLLVAASLAGSTPAATTARRSSRSRGIVVDQLGDPVADAKLIFTGHRRLRVPPFSIPGSFDGKTDSRGRFRLGRGDVAAGARVYRVAEAGYGEGLIGSTEHLDRPGLEDTDIVYVWRYFPDDALLTSTSALGISGVANGTVYTFYKSWHPYDRVLPRDQLPSYAGGGGPDFRTAQGAQPDGDLWVSAVPSADGNAAVVRVEVPNGGVQVCPGWGWDARIAPEDGYQERLEFEAPMHTSIAVQRVFTRRTDENGGVTFARYGLWGGRVTEWGEEKQLKFGFDIKQYVNPYGSRNLEFGPAYWELKTRELDAESECRSKLDEIYEKQGNKAAIEYRIAWQKETKARRAREHEERRERSAEILPEVLELEKRRLVYKPIMEAVLAGEPHPPWPGITPEKGRRTRIPPSFLRKILPPW